MTRAKIMVERPSRNSTVDTTGPLTLQQRQQLRRIRHQWLLVAIVVYDVGQLVGLTTGLA